MNTCTTITAAIAACVVNCAAWSHDVTATEPEPEWAQKDFVAADLASCCDGQHIKAAGSTKLARTTLSSGAYTEALLIDIVVAIPSKMRAFETLRAALQADVRANFSRHGKRYAQCRLVVQAIRWPGSEIGYTLRINSKGDQLQEIRGSCQKNIETRGPRNGLPEFQQGDSVTIVAVKGIEYAAFAQGEAL